MHDHGGAGESVTAFSPAVLPYEVEQLTEDMGTKLCVDESAHNLMQRVEPGGTDDSKGRTVDGKSLADDGEPSGHGHPNNASTSATVSAPISADHAEATTEDVNMVQSSARVNDTSQEDDTLSTMAYGSDITYKPGGTPARAAASWPKEQAEFKRQINNLETHLFKWEAWYQNGYQKDRNDAAEKEKRLQEVSQEFGRERQWRINEAAEKENEIRRSQEDRAEYLHRVKDIKEMLSYSSVNNPGRVERRFNNWSGRPVGKPCAADARQQLNSLIDVITRRNVSALKSSDREQRLIVPQGNEELMEEINSLKHVVSNLESDNFKLRKNLCSMEVEYGKLSQGGSYRENSATPTHVSEGFTSLSVAVNSFKSRLANHLQQNFSADEIDTGVSKFYGNVNPLRQNHFPQLLLKAKATSILFQNFENESFDKNGYCVCPDPARRKEMFFAWFLDFRNHKGDQFVQYFNRIKARAWKTFKVKSENVEGLEIALRKAAESVWCLHLLSFSFEPPASVFRVQCGATFEKNYMEAPPYLEVDQDSVATVAFMMTPGLRVDKISFIKSEIYPTFEDLKTGHDYTGIDVES